MRCFITNTIIKQCILRLKSGKDDGVLGFKSDHLINGNHRLHVVLSLLFNVMINHGYTPDVYENQLSYQFQKILRYHCQIEINIEEFHCLIVFVNYLIM